LGKGWESYPVPHAAEVGSGFEDLGSETCEAESVEGVAASEAGSDDEGVEGVVGI
jgi:hypothetical protein